MDSTLNQEAIAQFSGPLNPLITVIRPKYFAFSQTRLLQLLIASVCVLTLSSACSPMETRVEQGYREGILWVGNGGEPRNLDPHTVTGLPEFSIIRALFEGLVELDSKTLQPIPAAADRWEASEDLRTIRFHLNPAGRWSNGNPVTAEDFLFSWQRMLSPALGAQYASELYILKGARDYHQGRTNDFSSVGVKVIDSHTLEVELEIPMPTDYVLRLMAHSIWVPVHKDTILQHGRIDQRDTRWTRAGNLVGNGDFVLRDWNVNAWIRVVPNIHHRNREQLDLHEIRFIPVSNQQTEERLFRTGMLHTTNGLLPSRLGYYRDNASPALRTDPWFGTYYLVINTKAPPLDDVRVRKALAYSIHRENIVTQIVRGNQQPAYSFVPPGLHGWPQQQWFAYSPERAKQLLREAHVPTEAWQSIRYLFNTQEVNTSVAEAITHMWQQELGIRIGTINQEWKVYLDSRRARNFEILRASWIGDYPDPVTFLGLWTTDSTNNATGWSNAEYDRLLHQAAGEKDPVTRYQLLSRAEGILMEEMPVIPLYFLNRTYLLDSRIKGWDANLLDRRPWSAISFTKEK